MSREAQTRRAKRGGGRFHRAAGEVIRKADDGRNETEEIALGSKSEYAAASGAVVSALMKMLSKAA